MAFYSGFFNAKNNDRVYSAEDFTTYLSSLICNGILDTYGDNFSYKINGLKLEIGTGKAWLDGHYFLSDTKHIIDLSKYVDVSLAKYVAIGIILDMTSRTIGFEVLAGTAASSPSIPKITTSTTRKALTLFAVKLSANASSISTVNDYRNDNSKCGYCRCILGKCKVSEILDSLSAYNTKVSDLTSQINSMKKRLDEIEEVTGATGVVLLSSGQCGANAFYALYSNGKLNITGSGDTYNKATPSESSFYNNANVKNVIISGGITSIGDYLFMDCSNMESISIPTTMKNIGANAFQRCGVKSIVIPSSVKNIETYLFEECTKLQSAEIHSSMMSNNMLTSCSSLSSLIIGKEVKKFGSNMLTYCGVREITYQGTRAEWSAITKPNNWICSADGYHNSILEKISCTDGYFKFQNGSWYGYKN